MANDSLRTTLCVRFRAEVVASGILFTAARKLQVCGMRVGLCWGLSWQRSAGCTGALGSAHVRLVRPHGGRLVWLRLLRGPCMPIGCKAPTLSIQPARPGLPCPAPALPLQIPLPENPPWWLLFEVQEEELVEVCATLCDLYRQPRAQHVPLVKLPPGSAAAAAAAAATRSPLSHQPTPPLRSPATGTHGGGASASAALQPAKRSSDGEAPSVGQQAPSKSGAAAAGGTAGAEPEPSTARAGAANGTAAPAADNKQQKEKERDKEGDSRSERRRRSPSRERSRSRSRSRSRGRGGGRSSRRRHGRDSRSRSRSGGDRGGKRRHGRDSRSSSRSPSKERRRERERREDQPLYRPSGGGRPPRRDERRREGVCCCGCCLLLPPPPCCAAQGFRQARLVEVRAKARGGVCSRGGACQVQRPGGPQLDLASAASTLHRWREERLAASKGRCSSLLLLLSRLACLSAPAASLCAMVALWLVATSFGYPCPAATPVGCSQP